MPESGTTLLRSAVHGASCVAAGLLDWFYPPHCRQCGLPLSGRKDRLLCDHCHARLERTRIRPPVCDLCGLPMDLDPARGLPTCLRCGAGRPHFDRARSLFAYSGPAMSLIVDLKFHGAFYLADWFVRRASSTGWLGEAAAALGSARPVDVVAPVPLHPRRRHERGYDQALLIARSLAPQVNAPLCAGALRRLRYTEPQTRLTAARRWKNVRGAFACGEADWVGRHVLLVDDVMTTGATASECARVLKRGGAAMVSVLTLARTRS